MKPGAAGRRGRNTFLLNIARGDQQSWNVAK